MHAQQTGLSGLGESHRLSASMGEGRLVLRSTGPERRISASHRWKRYQVRRMLKPNVGFTRRGSRLSGSVFRSGCPMPASTSTSTSRDTILRVLGASGQSSGPCPPDHQRARYGTRPTAHGLPSGVSTAREGSRTKGREARRSSAGQGDRCGCQPAAAGHPSPTGGPQCPASGAPAPAGRSSLAFLSSPPLGRRLGRSHMTRGFTRIHPDGAASAPGRARSAVHRCVNPASCPWATGVFITVTGRTALPEAAPATDGTNATGPHRAPPKDRPC